MRGAGGSPGGLNQFFIGLAMMCGGFYMFFNAIIARSHFGMGMRLYGFNAFGGHYSITSGMVLIPFIFGIGMIFYNSKNILGWMLTGGSLIALSFGVISSLQFSLKQMSAFDLLVILVLSVGGLGLFLRSLKSFD